MAHLSFAELLQRHVPLSSGEAVGLALAAAAAADPQGSETRRVSVPDVNQILLSSTGHISFAADAALEHGDDEASALASVLLHLLGINDEGLRTDANGRIPGGLLIVLARVRRQIDLPPLTLGALREALSRFSAGSDPSALAAVFWRAARMRARTKERRLLASPQSPSPVERRGNGPSNSDLRRWLRQAERDAYELQRAVPMRIAAATQHALHQIKAAAGTVALVVMVCGGIALGLGVLIGSPPRAARAVASDPLLDLAVPSYRVRTVSDVGVTNPFVAEPHDTGEPKTVRAVPRRATGRRVPSRPTPRATSSGSGIKGAGGRGQAEGLSQGSVVAAPARIPLSAAPPVPAASVSAASASPERRPAIEHRSAPEPERPKTVKMVNLPRATWSQVH